MISKPPGHSLLSGPHYPDLLRLQARFSDAVVFCHANEQKDRGRLGKIRERRDCTFFCNRHVQNFPLHQQREIRIGPLTMHRGHIFGRVNYFLSDCASISQGKDKHDMTVDMAVYGGRSRSFIPSNRKH